MAWVAPAAEVEAYLRRSPQVKAGVDAVARSLHGSAVELARVRATVEGDYAAGIRIIDLPGGHKAVVATADHSWFVEVGTGIFGPYARRIVAQPGRPFVFYVMDGGQKRKVVTGSHTGRPARHVMRDAAIRVASLPGLRWNPRL